MRAGNDNEDDVKNNDANNWIKYHTNDNDNNNENNDDNDNDNDDIITMTTLATHYEFLNNSSQKYRWMKYFTSVHIISMWYFTKHLLLWFFYVSSIPWTDLGIF